MKISVVIVTYNGGPWIQRCLKSVYGSSISVDVIVIDNNSTDNTLELLNEFPNAVVLKQDRNLGFGQANNIGIAYALKQGADYLMLLNQDTYVEPDTIQKLIEHHNLNPNYGVISPIHLNGKGNLLDDNFVNYISTNRKLIYDAIRLKFTQPIYQVEFVNAACWLMPKAVFKIIGGFDPIFFHYGEDNNYCDRLHFFEYKIGVVPDLFIYHDREALNTNSLKLKDEFVLLERSLKVKWSNINHNYTASYAYNRKKIIKACIESILKINFKSFILNFKFLRKLKSIKVEIDKSRKQNVLKGFNYLK